jgi:ATP-binding cassette subfamily B protein
LFLFFLLLNNFFLKVLFLKRINKFVFYCIIFCLYGILSIIDLIDILIMLKNYFQKSNKYIFLIYFFYSELKHYWKYIFFMLFYSILYAFDLINRSNILKKIIDCISQGYSEANFSLTISYIIFYFCISICVHSIARLNEYYINAQFLPLMKKNFISKLFTRLLSHGNKFYQNNLPGALTSLVYEGAHNFTEIMKTVLEDIVTNISLVAFAFILLFKLNIMCGMIMASWIILFAIAACIFLPSLNYFSMELTNCNASIKGFLVDCITNISSIRFFSQKNYERKMSENKLDTALKMEYHVEVESMKLWSIYSFGFIFAQGVCIFYLIREWANGRVTSGDFVLMWTINMSLASSSWKFARDFGKLFRDIGSVYSSLQTIMKEVEIVDQNQDKDLFVSEGKIEFNNVTFLYEPRKKLFNKLSVVIPSGQKVGLVGLSGSGKTTFINLLLRVYDIHDGEVLIDNQNICHVGLDFLRKSIAIIPQEPLLFHRTVRENIQYGNMNASDDGIIEAAKKAHAHEFIENLPEGYNTIMGERGSRLSGGQRQRIAIARAILKNSPILILDEATSQLDAITEEQIQESINYVMKNKTTLVIAHRLSTLASMDRILVFDNGEIVQDGTHAQLIAKKGIYKSLWETQAQGFFDEVKENNIFEVDEL